MLHRESEGDSERDENIVMDIHIYIHIDKRDKSRLSTHFFWTSTDVQ